MSEQDNTYWQGVQTGQPVSVPINPVPQTQPATTPVSAPQSYTPLQQANPGTVSYQQPPSPYAAEMQQPASPYTAAPQQAPQQPVAYTQPTQTAQQSASVFAAQPVQQAGYPQAQPVYMQQPQPTAYPAQTQKYSGMAIAGMVLGIVALCSVFGDSDTGLFVWFVCTVLAFIFSILGMSKTDRKKAGFQRGRGMAIAGLVLSIVSICLFVLFIVLGVLFAMAMYGSGSINSYSSPGAVTTMASLLL